MSQEWKFETKALHVGQENADPLPIRGQFPFMQQHLTYSTIFSTQQTASDLGTAEISTADSLTLLRISSSRG